MTAEVLLSLPSITTHAPALARTVRVLYSMSPFPLS